VKKSVSGRVVKTLQRRRKEPGMDVRAKRVSAALRVPGRVVSIEVTKDEGRRGRRQKRRVKPRGTRRVGR